MYKDEESALRLALKFFEEAIGIDPNFSRAFAAVSRVHQRLGNYGRIAWSEAIKTSRVAAQKALSISPDLPEAETAVRELERLAPGHEMTQLNRGYLAALQGDRATVLRMIKELDATHEPGWARSSSAGFMYYAVGDFDRFFEYMYTAVRDHTFQYDQVRYSPLFAQVRTDPRFERQFESIDAEKRGAS